jgi:hypothetical protein
MKAQLNTKSPIKVKPTTFAVLRARKNSKDEKPNS